MKRTFALTFVVVVVLASLALSACNSPSATKKYIIATDASWPPMEFVDANKNVVGFDIDVMNAIAKEQGIEIEFRNTAWDGIFAGLETGSYDAVLSSVTITEERKQTYDFSDPYMNAGQAIVVLVGDATITGDQDLVGQAVGAQIGTTGAFAVADIPNATLKEYDTVDLAFLDLLNGNVVAVVCDTPVAADYALASPEYKGKVKIVGQPMTEEYYGLCVKKGTAQDLVKHFNEGLTKIKNNGVYDKLYAKWITG